MSIQELYQLYKQHPVITTDSRLETDAPYLAPVPCRGKRNEPAFLVHTAQKIAEILQMSLEDFGDATTANAKSLFSL